MSKGFGVNSRCHHAESAVDHPAIVAPACTCQATSPADRRGELLSDRRSGAAWAASGRPFLVAAALPEPDGLADAVAEEVEFRAADDGGAGHCDLGDPRGMEGELPLDPFALPDAAGGGHLPR